MNLRNEIISRFGIEYIDDPLPGPRNDDEVILDVPGYRQTKDYTCGFVAGLIVLHTFFPKRSAARFLKDTRPRESWGLTSWKLVKVLRKNGVGISKRLKMSFRGVKKEIDLGFPIITSVKTNVRGEYHWVVIYGYGQRPHRVFVAGNGIPYLDFIRGKDALWSKFSKTLCPDGEFLVTYGK